MNVFVLTTGRAGSVTFIKACRHMTNYTAGHETRLHKLGVDRLDYPDNHIEADNRLSWMLGRLGEQYPDAFYVHLTRDTEKVAQSHVNRYRQGIIYAYRHMILAGVPKGTLPIEVCRDYCETVDANIRMFLDQFQRHWTLFAIEDAKARFEDFWVGIGAQGDFQAALAEWDVRYNSSSRLEPLRNLVWPFWKALQK